MAKPDAALLKRSGSAEAPPPEQTLVVSL